MAALLVTGCGGKDDDPAPVTPPTDELTATDMSALELSQDVAAIFPAGQLVLGGSLTGETFDSPCKNPSDGVGDPDGPSEGTLDCRMAKLLADPDIYTNVGQEGFLESIAIFTKAFKLSLKSCAEPFAEDDREITVPVIGSKVEFACGRTPPVAELAKNMKAGLPAMFGDATEAQLATAFAGMKVSLLWGETSARKNILALMDMPPKEEGGSKELAAWWYSKTPDSGTIELQSVMYKTDVTNRRYLKGTPGTHEFVFNYIWNQPADSDSFAFRGAGYSEGAGKFYLIQAKVDSTTTTYDGQPLDGSTILDFCFAADTKALQADATECTALKTKLEAEVEFFTAAQVPDAEADITVPTY